MLSATGDSESFKSQAHEKLHNLISQILLNLASTEPNFKTSIQSLDGEQRVKLECAIKRIIGFRNGSLSQSVDCDGVNAKSTAPSIQLKNFAEIN